MHRLPNIMEVNGVCVDFVDGFVCVVKALTSLLENSDSVKSTDVTVKSWRGFLLLRFSNSLA